MSAPSPMDTYMHIIGSCAMSHPWYRNVHDDPVPNDPLFDHPDLWVGWSVSWTDDDTGKDHTVHHTVIMAAINKIATGDTSASGDAMAECLAFLDDPDSADFDAGTADEVIQTAAFGKVIYG